MRISVASVLFLTIFYSCSNEKKEETPPPAPVSISSVNAFIKGKSFSTYKVGTISNFEMDKENPYQWLDEKKDTTKFMRDYLAGRVKFAIQFVNDSTATLTDDGKTISAIYKLDNKTGEDEKEGIKFRFTYEDKDGEMMPGATDPVIMTSTYIIKGIDAENLLLEAPRELNNRKLAVLMKAK